jgi:hypothetical protein
LEDRPEKILDSVFSLPIVIQEHRVGNVLFKGNIYNDGDKVLLEPSILLNGMPYNHFCLAAIYKKQDKLKKITRIVEHVSELELSGEKFFPLDVTVSIDVVTRNHFGYVNDLPNSIILKGETGEQDRAVIDSKEIMSEYEFRKWPVFLELSDTPSHLGILKCGSIKPSLQDDFVKSVFESMKKK